MSRATILMSAIDAIAIVALLSSREVFLPVLLCSGVSALAALVLMAVRRGEATPPWLSVTSIVIALATAFVLISRLRIHPVDAAANTALLVHAALFLGGRGVRARQSRVAYCFMEIVLAAALNPEPRTAFLIFLYFAVASQLMTLNYLERTAPGLPKLAVGRMLRFSLVSALITFLVSLATAPLLPKLRFGMGGRGLDYFPQLTPGYSEAVDLAAFGKWSGGGNTPAIRVISPKDTPLQVLVAALPHKLLRGRVLERFDGSRWIPVPAAVAPAPSPHQGALVLEIQREASGSHGVPVPYGTQSVVQASSESDEGVGPSLSLRSFQRRESGDWMSLGSGFKRLRYFASVEPASLNGAPPTDKPRDETRMLPPQWKNAGSPWQKLRADVFDGRRSVSAMALAAEEYFAQSGLYQGELTDRSSVDGDVKAAFEDFLFKNRRGHCGLFAAAVALLFRQEGVPTRVVSGYKIPRIVTGVMTLRSRDAHAWVEVWDGKNGHWIVLDPTPQEPLNLGGPGNWMREAMESVAEALWVLEDGFSLYWFRSVVKGAEDDDNSAVPAGTPQAGYSMPRFSVLAGGTAFMGAVALLLALALWFWGRRNDRDAEIVPRALLRVRRRLSRVEKRISAEDLARLRLWDERLRFSRLREEQERWASELREYEQEVRRCAQAARAVRG